MTTCIIREVSLWNSTTGKNILGVDGTTYYSPASGIVLELGNQLWYLDNGNFVPTEKERGLSNIICQLIRPLKEQLESGMPVKIEPIEVKYNKVVTVDSEGVETRTHNVVDWRFIKREAKRETSLEEYIKNKEFGIF